MNKPLLPELEETELEEMSIKKNRDRYSKFPNRLPTFSMMPFPIDEHKHIGNYESKHTLYLTIANAYNKLMDRCDKLEEEIKKLNGK